MGKQSLLKQEKKFAEATKKVCLRKKKSLGKQSLLKQEKSLLKQTLKSVETDFLKWQWYLCTSVAIACACLCFNTTYFVWDMLCKFYFTVYLSDPCTITPDCTTHVLYSMCDSYTKRCICSEGLIASASLLKCFIRRYLCKFRLLYKHSKWLYYLLIYDVGQCGAALSHLCTVFNLDANISWLCHCLKCSTF